MNASPLWEDVGGFWEMWRDGRTNGWLGEWTSGSVDGPAWVDVCSWKLGTGRSLSERVVINKNNGRMI